MESGRYGLFHLCNQGACTRLELARQAAILANLPAENIVGKPMAEMKRKAPRPEYSVMEMKALSNAGILPPRHWKDALAEYVEPSKISREFRDFLNLQRSERSL